jgi:hypothetical protein
VAETKVGKAKAKKVMKIPVALPVTLPAMKK